MIKDDYLVFLNDVSCKKPNDFCGKDSKCPFCEREKLKDVLYKEGPYIFLKNKYVTLKDTDQFLIIETYTCEKQMHEYSEEYMKKLIRFSMKMFIKLESSNKYKSVIFYKNYGKNSGGSLKHPHMQIVGLKNIDYRQNITKENFEGISIYDNNKCSVTLSDMPINAFTEFNIIINDDLNCIDEFSCCILKTIKYILYDYFAECRSFNLFFYHYNEKIICKVCPRFLTSPLILGYKIKQISNKLDHIAEGLKNKYFKD